MEVLLLLAGLLLVVLPGPVVFCIGVWCFFIDQPKEPKPKRTYVNYAYPVKQELPYPPLTERQIEARRRKHLRNQRVRDRKRKKGTL